MTERLNGQRPAIRAFVTRRDDDRRSTDLARSEDDEVELVGRSSGDAACNSVTPVITARRQYLESSMPRIAVSCVVAAAYFPYVAAP